MSIPPLNQSTTGLPSWDEVKEKTEPPIEKPEPKLPDGGLNYCW